MTNKLNYDTIITDGPKFFGERLAVKLAFNQALGGIYDECIFPSHELVYYCRVTLPNNYVVYFYEDAQGVVREITATEYERATEECRLLEW